MNKFDILPTLPLPQRKYNWFYAPYDYEIFLLTKLKRNKDRAKLKVGYPGAFHTPSGRLTAIAELPENVYSFQFCGTATVSVNGKTVPLDENKLTLSAASRVVIDIAAAADSVPAFSVDNAGKIIWYNEKDQPLNCVSALSGTVPPHAEEIPQAEMSTAYCQDGIYDAGAEVLAYVIIAQQKEPMLQVGECLEEALNEDPDFFEQTTAVENIGENLWQSVVPLAFRYVKIKNYQSDTNVKLSALVHPVEYRGTFKCSDEFWNEVWGKSAYTLHLCMHHFLLDGIKRDRLPWGGDALVSVLGNMAVFADNRIIGDTLKVLESSDEIGLTDVNTIVDYTLQLFLNHDFYCRYSGDWSLLRQEYSRLKQIMLRLLNRCEDNFMLTGDIARIYIDWYDVEKTTALQMMFVWALEAMSNLADRMDDTAMCERCTSHRSALMDVIEAECFDPATGLYRSAPDGKIDSVYPQGLAILSQCAQGERAQKLAQTIASDRFAAVGTPYSAFFQAAAIAKSGMKTLALEYMRKIWKYMLDLGATSFFELSGKEDPAGGIWQCYTRPFGQSLCHAWGAGPSFLLPLIFSGAEPLADGWKEFKLTDPLTDMDYCIKIPTPNGAIAVTCSQGKIEVNAPSGCRRI